MCSASQKRSLRRLYAEIARRRWRWLIMGRALRFDPLRHPGCLGKARPRIWRHKHSGWNAIFNKSGVIYTVILSNEVLRRHERGSPLWRGPARTAGRHPHAACSTEAASARRVPPHKPCAASIGRGPDRSRSDPSATRFSRVSACPSPDQEALFARASRPAFVISVHQINWSSNSCALWPMVPSIALIG